MEWNWLQSLLFGFLSGFGEFLPVSSDAHQRLFAYFTGAGNELLGFRLFCHAGSLLALLTCCRLQLRRLSRDRRIAAVSPKRRKRQPDRNTLMDLRVIRTASAVLLLGFLLYLPAQSFPQRLWVLALALGINGLILYLPQFFRTGNKESLSMSALDSLLIGLGGILGVVPGISRTGLLLSTARLRGLEGRYGADMALILSIPALLALIGFDIYGIATVQGAFSASLFFPYLLASAAAFAGAGLSVLLIRFLAVRIGFSGFAYYCWGTALLTFVLYLTI